jgi:hypothetical protein
MAPAIRPVELRSALRRKLNSMRRSWTRFPAWSNDYTLCAATMASPMPVLPLVGSTVFYLGQQLAFSPHRSLKIRSGLFTRGLD